MIKSLREARIVDGVPRIVAGQEWVQALSEALGVLHEKTLDFADASQIYTALDTAPEDVLDALAVNWKIDWYDTGYTVEQKRKIVKTALTVRRLMGTVRAVKLQADAIYPGTDVEEWFDYGGDAGYFRLFVNITDSSEENPMIVMPPEEIERRLVTAKRWSAHMESFSYMVRHALLLGAKAERWAVRPPVCGTIYCGTHWEPSTLGYSEGATVLANAGPEAFPVSPELTGTLPQNAVAAYTVCGGMVSGGATAGYTVAGTPAGETQACGTLPEEA